MPMDKRGVEIYSCRILSDFSRTYERLVPPDP